MPFPRFQSLGHRTKFDNNMKNNLIVIYEHIPYLNILKHRKYHHLSGNLRILYIEFPAKQNADFKIEKMLSFNHF